MATFEYNDKIKFILPSEFSYKRFINNEGEEVNWIVVGESDDSDHSFNLNFTCDVRYIEFGPKDIPNGAKSENLLDILAERQGCPRRMKLHGKPNTIILDREIPVQLIFGKTLLYFADVVYVQMADWSFLQLIIAGKINKHDPHEYTVRYENIYKVLQSTRINGKKLPIDGITPYDIEKELHLTKDKTGTKKTSSTRAKTTAEKASTKKTSTSKSANKSSSTAATKMVSENTVPKSDCNINKSGTLTAYKGKSKVIILPDGIKAIGREAFYVNNSIRTVVIPEGVEIIGNKAFLFCNNLESVTLPSTIKKIEKEAFGWCEKLTSITIPDGCNEIGVNCFKGCYKLKDIYVTDSVLNLGDGAFDTLCDTIIHTSKGSVAERMAKKCKYKVEYEAAPSVKAPAKKSSTKQASGVDKKIAVADTMSGLGEHIIKMQKQELSAEDRENINIMFEQLDKLKSDLDEGMTQMEKYDDYLEQNKAKEKIEEEEKKRKKAKAMAAGKSEKDIVNMYIILTNEKKLGKLYREEDDFYEEYDDSFPAMSRTEVIKSRKEMLEDMGDDSLCKYYVESFKQRSVEDRFFVSTRNLYGASTEPEIDLKADWAIENTKEWYQPFEYDDVRKLMEAELADTRKKLDDQIKPVDEAWTNFSTSKEFLQIVISNKAADGSDLESESSNFQVVMGDQLVAVQLASKGIFSISTTVMNCFTWYWGVTVRDIWEVALKNKLKDNREGANNGMQLANQAITQIRSKYPETKVTSFTTATVDSNQQTSSKPVKKEGCYIATAVYGSYDAPQVMTLRRYRDETLSNTAFGRWFIKIYYRFSPTIAEKLKNAKRLNKFVRSILDKWVEKIDQKQK